MYWYLKIFEKKCTDIKTRKRKRKGREEKKKLRDTIHERL